MANEVKSSTLIGISVSASQVEKLGEAFLGFDAAKQKKVEEDAKTRGVSMNQATFDAIFEPRLEVYVRRAEKKADADAAELIRIASTRFAHMTEKQRNALKAVMGVQP